MSQIHIINGQENIILDYITAENIIDDDNHKKSLKDTLETYSFITFADRRFSQYLEKRNRIIIPDEDGSLVEFVIFEAHKYKDTEGHKAQVYAHASYLELKKASILYPGSFTGSASQHGGRALNDTGWQIGVVEGKGTRKLTIENHTNPYEMLKRIAKEFSMELKFRTEHDGNRITGRYVDLLERVGEWRGREVEFGKDLDGIRRVEKQDIVTALLGLGPEDEDGNRLEVLVEDDDALQRWGWIDEHGALNHLIEPYEIQSERTEMTEEEARQYTRTALNKRINTQVTFETTIVDLENVPGMENKKIRFGDTIKIKDTTFNPPLYLEARVFEQTRSIKSKAKKDIKLGDFIEHTEEEVNAIWKQLQKEVRSRVSHYEMMEYTYDKLTIDDKDETVFADGKTFAEATGITAEENAKDFAVKQDAQIKVDVEDYADTVAEQKAESALDQAKMYAVSKEVYENEMNRIASDIEDRAPLEYVDGQFVLIGDELDNFNAEIVEKADKSIVYTISDVDNMINNTVSKTQYTTDMNGIVTDLNSHGTRIGQNETAIGLKADSSKLDAVENSLTTKVGNIEVTAEGAKMTANQVKADLDDVDGRVEKLDASVTTLAGEVSLKASQSVVDSLEGRVSTAEGELSVLPGEINAKVSKDGLVSEINAQPGHLLIDFDRVQMTGELEAKHIKSLNGLNINDQFIVDNSGNVRFSGNLQGASGTFSGALSGATGTFSGEIQAAQLVVENPNLSQVGATGLKLELAMSQENVTNPYRKTGYAVFRSEHDGLFVFKEDLRGRDHNLDHFHVEARVLLINGKVQVGQAGTGGSAYGVEFPQLHSISASPSEGHFSFYGNRARGQRPFHVRSHLDKASGAGNNSYRDDFYIGASTGAMYNPGTYSSTSSNAANVRIGASGQFYRTTSARKYKKLIEPIKVDPYNIYKLQPSDWYDKPQVERLANAMSLEFDGKGCDPDIAITGAKRVAGLIAEDVVDAGLEIFVEYDDSGEVEGLQYDRLWTLLIPISRDHEVKITDLEVKFEECEVILTNHEKKIIVLEKKVEILIDEVNQLKGAA